MISHGRSLRSPGKKKLLPKLFRLDVQGGPGRPGGPVTFTVAASQSVSQPVYQLVSQPISKSVYQFVSPPVSQSANQPVSPPVSLSVMEPISQSNTV